MERVYPSKKDTWLVVVIGSGLVLPIVLAIYILTLTDAEPNAGWVVIFASTISAALMFSFLYPLYYKITHSTLIVRSGILRWRIPLPAIQEISATRNPLSSPALSLDRLKITYQQNGRNKFILISPHDHAAFIRDLQQAAPNIKVTHKR